MDVSGTPKYGLNNLSSINDIANNEKFKNFLTSWMFREYLSFVGACVINGFDMNWFTNLKHNWTYLHLSKQCMLVSLKFA